jgi:nucleoid-associated protein YgaU
MESASSRLLAAVACLALVWIGAYWLYEPSGRDAGGLAPLPSVTETPLPAARTDPQPAPQPAPPKPEPRPAPVQPQPQPVVIAPQFDDYVVKPGETYETIAKARFGTSRLGLAISRANPLKDPKRLRPGDTIRIPRDPENIQGKPASSPVPNQSGTPTTPPSQAEYLVQKGDTLSGIARTVWGSGKHWRRIMDANASLLPTEESLRPGMRLRIPPKPAD